MKLNNYLNKKVQIVLTNGFTYIGEVVDCGDDFLTLIDKTKSQVTLKQNSIEFIRELT